MTPERQQELLNAEKKLQALEEGGVDNWEHYDIALKPYRDYLEQQERVDNAAQAICTLVSEHVEEPAGRGCGYGITEEGLAELRRVIVEHFND